MNNNILFVIVLVLTIWIIEGYNYWQRNKELKVLLAKKQKLEKEKEAQKKILLSHLNEMIIALDDYSSVDDSHRQLLKTLIEGAINSEESPYMALFFTTYLLIALSTLEEKYLIQGGIR